MTDFLHVAYDEHLLATGGSMTHEYRQPLIPEKGKYTLKRLLLRGAVGKIYIFPSGNGTCGRHYTDNFGGMLMNWITFGVGTSIFLFAAILNVYVLFILPRRGSATGKQLSPLPVVGGLMGAIGCLFAPSIGVKWLFWLPILLDPGTGYYFGLAVRSYRQSMTEMSAQADKTPLCRATSGSLLGTAVGDALGLPVEGMSRRRQQAVYPGLDRYHFLFGKGCCSDDTEHACMTANALITARHDSERFVAAFRDSLAWRLRFWLVGLPAGVGFATARGIIKLWCGISADCSGVFSAGNGPVMRAPIIGVLYGSDRGLLAQLVRASTRLTHTDPRAEHAAFAVALAAHYSASGIHFIKENYLRELRDAFGETGEDTLGPIEAALISAEKGERLSSFAAAIGCSEGISGFVLHTVPACLHAWRTYPNDFRSAVLSMIHCGGDTDTTGAIVGGIVGAGVGPTGIPRPWLDNLVEWPRTVDWLKRLGVAAVESTVPANVDGIYRAMNPPLLLPGILFRNLLFLMVVLMHGIRRILPPYRPNYSLTGEQNEP